MNNFFTENQKMIRDICREIAVNRIKPEVARLDEEEEFPHEIMKVIAQSDMCGVYIPEEYGGIGGGVLDLCIATEEFSRICGGVAVTYAATALGTFPILLFGNEEQKKRFLPAIASGEKLAAFGLTEPAAGSDAGALRTQAVRDGDHYILNGTKHFITNGGEAEIYTVVAKTNPAKGSRGASAFIVEKGTEGFSFGKKEKKMGIRTSATCELVFEDCRVPKENLIRREGMGFLVAMKTFDKSRPGVAAQAVGIAQGALDLALEYAKERKQFGQSISSFQGVQFMLADMATQVEAARQLVYSVARSVDAGDKDIGMESAMCKLYASDVAMKVSTDAVQIFGGYGYMRDYPIEKFMRDAKITQIYEGTNQIQRGVIATNLVKRSAKQRDKVPI